MSRLFDDASTQRLETDTAAATAVPLTMACWFYSDQSSVAQTLMCLADKDNDFDYMRLKIGEVASNVSCESRSDTSGQSNASSYSINTWTHAAGVWASTASRTAYLNGSAGTTNTTSEVPSGLDRTSIGRLGRSSATHYMSGRIAEAAMWNVALSADEIAALADGVVPLLIKPESLICYWPIWGSYSPEVDLIGGLNLTVTGATKDEHSKAINRPSTYTVFDLGGGSSPSATPSSSPSSSVSATPSSSPSASVSATPSSSPSASVSATPSASPSVSATPSGSPSASPSATPSPSPSASVSATPSASASATPSATPSASVSATPSVSPSASVSATPSASPSASVSATPSASPSQSPSASPSPSFSISASPSESPSGSETTIRIEGTVDGGSRVVIFQMTNIQAVTFDFEETEVE